MREHTRFNMKILLYIGTALGIVALIVLLYFFCIIGVLITCEIKNRYEDKKWEEYRKKKNNNSN